MRLTDSPIPIAFDDAGTGEPALLCLPGWCVDRTAFRDLLAASSTSRRVLAMDWRGHGESGSGDGEFGEDELVADALAVIEASGADRVVPVALAHAGWVAREVRRRLPERIPALILVDWLVLDPPPPFVDALAMLQREDSWRQTRDRLFAMWLEGVDTPAVERLVHDVMGSYDFAMWARGGRAIGEAYARHGSPLAALAALDPPPPVLHLYAQPDDPEFLRAQEAFAGDHPWYHVHKLSATSHFPMLEVADGMTAAIERFIATSVAD